MTDPWADMRFKHEHEEEADVSLITSDEIDRLLTDADALLAVRDALQGIDDYWGDELPPWPKLRKVAEAGREALAALPEHLK